MSRQSAVHPPSTDTHRRHERARDPAQFNALDTKHFYFHTDIKNQLMNLINVKAKPVVKVEPDQPVFSGETVTLTCVTPEGGGDTQWTYRWFRDGLFIHNSTERVHNITSHVSDSGQYSCEAKRSEFSDAVSLNVSEIPTPVVKVKPDQRVFSGETVTLTCDIPGGGDTQWTYRWFRDGYTDYTSSTAEYSFTADVYYSVKYSCRGERSDLQRSNISDALTLTVSDKNWSEVLNTATGLRKRKGAYWIAQCHGSACRFSTCRERPKPVVKVKPDQRVFRGETVTLTCVIPGGGDTQWTYSWFKDGQPYDTSPTAEISFTADVYYSVKYSCRGERSDSQRSNISDALTLTVSDIKLKPELTSDPAGAALTGNTVNLTCGMDPSTGRWDFYWYKHTLNPETEKTETNPYSLKIDSVSDGGQYWCRAGRGKPVYYTQYSDALWVNATESPKAVVTVRPDERVFRGETVTLRCDVRGGGDTEWTYKWEIEENNSWYKNSVSRTSTQELIISRVKDFHSGKYTCTGLMKTQRSQRSNAVTLTVSAKAQAVVRVSPQPWLTEGESATLICEAPVSGSSTGWAFSWFRDHDHLSDSSRGAGGSYTLSPASLQHTGVYTCRAERGRPAYHTHTSSTQPLWVTGVSASVSLVIKPSRSQHFSSESLALSCEDQSNSAGWTVRRYTDKGTQTCSDQTGSSCVMDSLSTSDTGVYWCESESGEKRRPRNITVHDGEVILSSVDHVIEGETLTLHCLHRSTNPSIFSAGFYKDETLIQNQTTGEMSITTVSKSHEGFYYCKTERGASPHSWISVRVSAQISGLKIFSFLLAACQYLIATVVLLYKCYRARVSSAQDQSQFAVTEDETSI
ncbi:Fc receptor-like protein 5 [Pseudorasbora parva]|uniref:Fc receptor-like protein 5 n=1 Tax=Pseudorasbora parva TaxID=51549 RepID=UPI00351F4499